MAKFNKDNLVAREKQRMSDPLNSLYGEFEEIEESSKNSGITELEIGKLKASSINRFSEIEGDDWTEFVGSIKEHGIYTPIIVRPIEAGYEILAGHNRVRAAKEIGLTQIPAIIKDVDDVEAAYINADTNLQRPEVTDLEKGWAYRSIYDAISNQGKRTDLTSSHDGTKSRADEIIAQKYGIGRNTVQRKIRLTYLLRELYEAFSDNLITQDEALYFSYLKNSEQMMICSLLNDGIKFNKEKAKAIKELAENSDDRLSDVDILNLLKESDEEEEKVVRPKKPKVPKFKVDEDLFPVGIRKGEREAYIDKALRYIKAHGIEV